MNKKAFTFQPLPDPGIDWWAVTQTLRANEGQWMFIGRHDKNTPDELKYQMVFRPIDSFEWALRKPEGDYCDIYVRYVGEHSIAKERNR